MARVDARDRSTEHEDASHDEGEGEGDAGGEKGAFLRKVSAFDTFRSVRCGLESHIVFPLHEGS